MARVSVLFPNYNNEPYLQEALDSIFNQSYSDFLIFFVDDCSTDNSLAIAESYQDDRLIIHRKEQNSGIVDTMNVALSQIETEYYIRMDGDDISSPDRFQILVDFMDANPEIGVCSSAIQTFGIEDDLWSFGKDPEMNKANLIFGHSVGHASSIFRTAVMKQNNIQYVDRFWGMEDYYLFYRLKDLAKTTAIDDPLYLYRREEYNAGTEIKEKKRKVFQSFYEMVLTDLGLEPTEKRVSLHMQLSKKEEPRFKLKIFLAHREELLSANGRTNLFPQKELDSLLRGKMNTLCFRMIDTRQIDFFGLLPYFFKTKGLLKYYLSKRFRK